MRGPVRRLGDRVARRVAFEVARHTPAPEAPEPTTRDQYGAIAVLRDRPCLGQGGLGTSELRVFSQNGEDGVLAEIFGRIGVEHHAFVEFGVQDGVQCNTRYLAEVLGWSGTYFEGDPDQCAGLEARLANRSDLTTTCAMVTPDNVEDLFDAAGVPEEVDLLSIDVDGQDYWIWEAIERYRPRVVTVEFNSALPAAELLVEPLGRSEGLTLRDFFGASLGALRALGEHKGYTLVHTELAGVNAFFVRDDLAGPFDAPPLARGPNFDLRGHRHARDDRGGRYVRVSPGDQASGDRTTGDRTSGDEGIAQGGLT